MRHGFNVLIVMANKMLSEFQFQLAPTRREGERGRKEWVKSWVGISLQSYSPLMCDEWLCGRCEIGSIKMPHFSSGVWWLSEHHLRYQHIFPALLDATHEENSNKQTVTKSQAYWTWLIYEGDYDGEFSWFLVLSCVFLWSLFGVVCNELHF